MTGECPGGKEPAKPPQSYVNRERTRAFNLPRRLLTTKATPSVSQRLARRPAGLRGIKTSKGGVSMNRNLYGLVGYKGHGKDTFAKMVQKEEERFSILHFADKLKHIVRKVFGFSAEQMEDPRLKESPFWSPIFIDGFVQLLQQETGVAVGYHGKWANTPREVLQLVGTEYVRDASPGYWVEVLRDALSKEAYAIVADVRFQDEYDMIKALGGRIINVRRLDLELSKDGHVSEANISTLPADLHLGFLQDDFEMHRYVAYELSKGDFQSASEYDYKKWVCGIFENRAIGRSENSLVDQRMHDYYSTFWRV